MLKRFASVCAALIVLAADTSSMAQERTPAATPFAAGQVWRYKARPQEPASRVLILLVEPDRKLGQIIHVRISGLRLKGGNGETSQVGHLPFKAAALRLTLTSLESRKNPVPSDYEGGYKTWKAAFDAGKAGVFTVPIAEVLDDLESAGRRRP